MNTLNNDKFIAKAAKALGDRYRLRIFQEICRLGSINCTQAQQLTNLAQPSISNHIRTLVYSELVDKDKRGREVHLVVNQEKMKAFFSAINQISSGHEEKQAISEQQFKESSSAVNRIASEQGKSPANTRAFQPGALSDLVQEEEGKGSATSQPGAPKITSVRHLPFD